ncbi:hypothetical protein ACQPU1_13165 [Clostridium paraputrificum]|uniref:hypothetical protein n=1 Tax=Clostridium paraputrificum TaxID=29363 RepID=UPI003D329296
MNKSTLKTILYVVAGLIIFSAVVSLFLSLLPFLIGGGIIIYLGMKVYGYFSSKKSAKESSYGTSTYSYTSEEIYSNDTVDTSEVIDVDYKEVD